MRRAAWAATYSCVLPGQINTQVESVQKAAMLVCANAVASWCEHGAIVTGIANPWGVCAFELTS